jgi:ribosomal protein L21E
MKRIGTVRRKTRNKLSKSQRKKGKLSLTSYLQRFKPGDKVVLVAEPAVQKGMYHPNYYGKRGLVKAAKGRCYEVAIKDRTKEKILIVHPVHLKKV